MSDRPEVSRSRPRSPGPLVSKERYLVRRVVALVFASVLIVAAVKGIGLLFGGGGTDDTLDAAEATVAAISDETTAVPTGTPVAIGADAVGPTATTASVASASAAPATEPPPPTTSAPTTAAAPSATTPAKVLVVGDSDAGTFGPYLNTLLDETGIVETTVDYKVSSGLARPDFFDWPAHLAETLPATEPDIVVVTFGGNDGQGLALVDGTFPPEWGDPLVNEAEWSEEYERRAGEVMDLLLDGDRAVIWVGIPNDDSADVTARMSVQDIAAKAAAADRPDIVFVDTWDLFSGRTGNWAEYVVDPRDGQGKDVRADDGFHLNENGAEILALDIADVVRAELAARGADL